MVGVVAVQYGQDLGVVLGYPDAQFHAQLIRQVLGQLVVITGGPVPALVIDGGSQPGDDVQDAFVADFL